MYPDSPFAIPYGSFQAPVPPPTGHFDSPPLVQVCFSETWLPYVVGCLKQLLLEATWGVGNTALVAQMQKEAFELIDQFANPPVVPLCDADKPDWFIVATAGLNWWTTFDATTTAYNGSNHVGVFNVTTTYAYDEPLEMHALDRANPSLHVGGIWRYFRVESSIDTEVEMTVTLCDDTQVVTTPSTPIVIENPLEPSGGWKAVQIVPALAVTLIATAVCEGKETCSPV